jgi:hypothetical protein
LAESVSALQGKHTVVIGRGRSVGKPLAKMLVNAGATVTVCHSGTRDLPQISRSADVVFVATGRSRGFGREYFRDGQVIIDAGISFIDGKLAGDVNTQSLEPLDMRVTPVPGGVGPLTSVLILESLQHHLLVAGRTPDRRQYTCYGCHEHTKANIRAKHVREGIPNFTNCISCHRRAHGESGEGGGRERKDDD